MRPPPLLAFSATIEPGATHEARLKLVAARLHGMALLDPRHPTPLVDVDAARLMVRQISIAGIHFLAPGQALSGSMLCDLPHAFPLAIRVQMYDVLEVTIHNTGPSRIALRFGVFGRRAVIDTTGEAVDSTPRLGRK